MSYFVSDFPSMVCPRFQHCFPIVPQAIDVAIAPQQYQLVHEYEGRSVTSDLVTLEYEVNQSMLHMARSEKMEQTAVNVGGKLNHSGGWIRVERIALCE
jgi:hypothetical protein